jgi:hypothetical protein
MSNTKLFYKEINEDVKENSNVNNIELSSMLKNIKNAQTYNIIHPKNLKPINKVIFDGYKIRGRLNGIPHTLYVKDIISTQTARFSNLIEIKSILGNSLFIPKEGVFIVQRTKLILYQYDDNTFQLYDLNLTDINDVNIVDVINNTKHIIPQDNDNDLFITQINKPNYIFKYLM